MTINGITIKKREVISERERDGFRFPHEIREVEFNPPADLQFILKHDDIADDYGSGSSKFLT